ncbi:MAG: S-methyl-5'-thioinosine phosphorylase [Gammaproteobacteria bacterium]|nr:S-methyl-5'-thioinosine phosphorylase [Gammaproteobacteria bacterium]
MLAVIGGSGLTRMSSLEGTRSQAMRTPYGEPSDAITHGTIRGRAVMFLARHGSGHTIPPHEINYRANLWALKEAGADGIVAVASVGGVRADLGPGVLVVPNQIIDYTWGRRATYFEGGGVPVKHVDFTHPYAEGLRRRILDAARAAGEAIRDGGVYAATQGPRLESAAEIDRLERDGADLVGMTGMPEAVLARELDLEYAVIAVVVNHAAGRGDSKDGIALDGIEATLQQSIGRARRVIEELVAPT